LARADSQHQGFFDHHCASKDYDGCDNADGLERVRVTLLEEPQLRLSRPAMLRKWDCTRDGELMNGEGK
jgi:hypothetical protein